MTISAFIILTAIFALGLDAISYKYYATSAYWPVGEILYKDGSWLHALGFFAILSTPGIAFYLGSWWHALILIIMGFLTGFVLMMLLKSKIQPLIILGLPLLLVFGVSYIFIVSE